jgi:DNA-binding transcriptional ArsR family regulator
METMRETVREMLDRVEREILERLEDARRNIIAPMERELADVRRAKAALPRLEDLAPVSPRSAEPVVPPQSPYRDLTMKQLTVKALRERFPNGATAMELVEFFGAAWGRDDVQRSSLSPQLSRLKYDGVVELLGNKWFLVRDPDKREAPAEDQSEGASEAGGGTAPLFESQSDKDIFG